MIASPFYKLIQFNEFSATPKYQQLANSIIKAIESGKLQTDDVLPSINELSFQFEISRDTAEKGYKHLKKIGIISSVPGKGYFIKSTDVERKIKIFLMFNKLSAHKKILYDAFVSTLGAAATIDFYIYNNDFALFKKLLLNCKEDYHFYVIIPHFLEGAENAHKVINSIPKEKLILLDKKVPGVTGTYGAVYENFEKDIYTALEKALPQLSKYHTLNIIFPDYTYFPEEILHGFNKFCQDFAFNSKVIHNIKKEKINKGEVYINLMEDDLVILIEKTIGEKLEVGKDIGVISYNETALKRIILNGITTISTDFQMMGETTAKLILSETMEHIEADFNLTLRNSL
jgi:DNA-binding transcriptional regulator YhcF (GntR family)